MENIYISRDKIILNYNQIEELQKDLYLLAEVKKKELKSYGFNVLTLNFNILPKLNSMRFRISIDPQTKDDKTLIKFLSTPKLTTYRTNKEGLIILNGLINLNILSLWLDNTFLILDKFFGGVR